MIKKIINKLFYNPYKFVKKHSSSIKIGNTILTKSFAITLKSNSNKISIGNGCILSNTIIFETNTGSVSIGDNTYIGGESQIISRSSVSIGDNVQISWGVTIYDHDGNSLNHLDRRKEASNYFKNYSTNNMLTDFDWEKVHSKPIVIENDVWIGVGATILKGVTIGEGAIVGAQSLVARDVPPFTVVAGNPARSIKNLRN